MAGFPIAAKGGPPSPGALGQPDANALIARLKQSSPAANPQTPDTRLDASTERLTSANQVRVSLEKLMGTINDDEMLLKQLVIGMHGAINKMLAGVDPQAILSQITTQLGGGNAPAPPAPPMGLTAGMPGIPPPQGMQGGLPGSSVSPGMPPMGPG